MENKLSTIPTQVAGPPTNLNRKFLFVVFSCFLAVYAAKTVVFDAKRAKANLNMARIPEKYPHRHEKLLTNTNQQLNLA